MKQSMPVILLALASVGLIKVCGEEQRTNLQGCFSLRRGSCRTSSGACGCAVMCRLCSWRSPAATTHNQPTPPRASIKPEVMAERKGSPLSGRAAVDPPSAAFAYRLSQTKRHFNTSGWQMCFDNTGRDKHLVCRISPRDTFLFTPTPPCRVDA